MLQCSFLFIIQEIIIFMTSCKLVIGIYKGLYLACIMQTYGCPLHYGAFLATDRVARFTTHTKFEQQTWYKNQK